MNPKDLAGSKKPPLYLIPGTVKVWMAMALKSGADKYGPFNWREEKIQASEYISATERHLEAYKDGEDLDRKSGVPHLAHAIASLAVLLDATVTDCLIDDRAKSGTVADLLESVRQK